MTASNTLTDNVTKKKRKRKRLAISVVALILAAAIAVCAVFAFSGKSKKSQSYSYVRTTTLSKGTLENSISATGTVESAKASNVTTSLEYTVKNVNVAVGDKVSEGDVICTLDTSELEEQIEREESSLESSKKQAQSAYSSAKSSRDKAKAALDESKENLNEAKTAANDAKSPYTKAKNAVSSYQSAYNKALTANNNAGAKYASSQSEYNKAVSKFKTGKISASALIEKAKAYMSAVQGYSGGCQKGSYDISGSSQSTQSQSVSQQSASDSTANVSSSSTAVTIDQTADEICAGVKNTVYALTGSSISYTSKTGTLYTLAEKAESLSSAKTVANYDSLYSSYTSAKSEYDTAKQEYEQAQESLEQAETQLETAKTQLSDASTSDTLSQLESKLKECTLTAGQDGTVTALNATVGSSVNASMSAVATISDLDKLKVSITVEEADINNATLGMSCYISSDASDDTVGGTLTQIDPVAGDSGSFGAEVTVDGESDLRVGMNASVELLVSSKENVYQVPIDAVGSDDDGSFVYRKTSGEGTDMQFEKVHVTTGESNDYYIEISSDDLAEGDIIRSSSDLTQGIETGESQSSDSSSIFSLFGSFGGNGGGGNMPDMNASSGGDFGANASNSSGGGSTPPAMPGGDNR